MEAKLLAYTSLCRPILEHADVAWDPHAKQTIHKIELVRTRRYASSRMSKDVMKVYPQQGTTFT